jgi:hypothetical protein
MRVRSLPAFSRIFAVSFFALFGLRAIAATSDFAITAANVNMPASGNGSSEYTVTAIPMTGSLTVTCQYSGAATVARIPNCTYGPIEALPVTQAKQSQARSISYRMVLPSLWASIARPTRQRPVSPWPERCCWASVSGGERGAGLRWWCWRLGLWLVWPE